MFISHFDFRPYALIQHGTISIGKTHKGSGTKNHLWSLFGQHGAASGGGARCHHALPSPAEASIVELKSGFLRSSTSDPLVKTGRFAELNRDSSVPA